MIFPPSFDERERTSKRTSDDRGRRALRLIFHADHVARARARARIREPRIIYKMERRLSTVYLLPLSRRSTERSKERDEFTGMFRSRKR